MDHFVPVEALPKGLVFPPDLADRIRYDPATKRLSYRGFMSKADFDRLCKLHDDWAYRRPLEELFCLSTAEGEPRKGGMNPRLVAAIAGLGIAATIAVAWFAHARHWV
jgi:hypothetical protein